MYISSSSSSQDLVCSRCKNSQPCYMNQCVRAAIHTVRCDKLWKCFPIVTNGVVVFQRSLVIFLLIMRGVGIRLPPSIPHTSQQRLVSARSTPPRRERNQKEEEDPSTTDTYSPPRITHRYNYVILFHDCRRKQCTLQSSRRSQ